MIYFETDKIILYSVLINNYSKKLFESIINLGKHVLVLRDSILISGEKQMTMKLERKNTICLNLIDDFSNLEQNLVSIRDECK